MHQGLSRVRGGNTTRIRKAEVANYPFCTIDVLKLLPKGRIVDLTHTLVPGKELYMLDMKPAGVDKD